MTKTKNTKTSLISSVAALLLCFAMLLGTTFAWFTDLVTSAGNTIQSGSLKIDLLHKVEDDWVSVKENPTHKIFNYDKWEPGYTRVETVKAVNLGTLALQYKLSLTVEAGTETLGANGERLADVIEVYTSYGENNEASYDAITKSSAWNYKGTLAEVMANPSSFIGGQLLPTGETLAADAASTTAVESQMISIALHMKKDAGNAYQELSVGNIYVNLIATQWSYENDSFDNTYDEGAVWPELILGQSVSIPVGHLDADNKTIAPITMSGYGYNVTLPAGVKVVEGMDKFTLTVDTAERSSNINMNLGQVSRSLDVHIDGIDTENDVPVIIDLGAVLPVGYNAANIALYHVENGAANQMNLVDTPTIHNDFSYDPETGEVSVALASFSEVTAVIAEGDPWDGTFDTSWYNTTDTEFTLTTEEQFAGFAAIVGGMANGIAIDDFNGKTVKLGADLNLGGINGKLWYPVGYHNSNGNYDKVSGGELKSDVSSFEGIFDGQGNTISNIYQNTWDMFGDYNNGYSGTPNHYKDGMGIFGFVYNGTVKNLVVENFQSDGEFCTTGCVAAYASGSSTFENITIINSNPRAYNVPNGGVVGYAYDEDGATNIINFNNVTVDVSNKITALWGSWDVGCGGVLGRVNGNTTINMTNCTVGAVIDVYNDVCGNYQYYQYRYAGLLIGTVGGDGDPTNGGEKVNFSGVTVYVGDWADYYYCEFEKNSQGSYTDDFQFSRVERSEIMFDENNMPVECTHNHTVNEDKLALFLPFNQLYTGYGWGASPVKTADGVTIVDHFYSITYLDSDGSFIDIEYVIEGQNDETHNVADEKTITKTHSTSGKIFDGWVNVASEKVEKINRGNRKDIVLYATYAKECTVRWVDEDGNVISSVTVSSGTQYKNLTKPADPTSKYNNMTFDHWEIRNADKTYTKVADNYKITDDITFYPYYIYQAATGSIALTGVDVDGDGRADYYTVDAASNLDGVVTIPGEINGVPVTVITDLTNDDVWDAVGDLIGGGGITSIIIEEGVKEIQGEAFADTIKLNAVTIPVSIEKIGSNIFSTLGISSYYKDITITYNGTKAQWDNIEKASDWNSNTKKITVNCTDGTYTYKK